MQSITDGLAGIRERMAGACARAGRKLNEVELIAVSKNHPAAAVREAWAAGQQIFGENRVQEALEKQPESPGGARWHFLGRLQKNKIRRALPAFELFHSVDRLELAESMDRIAAEEGRLPRVLIEVNVSGEGTKAGWRPEELRRDLEALLGLKHLEIEGLMTLAPYADDPEEARPVFRALREFRDGIAAATELPFGTLSMGMSGDFEVAIEEGATMVRVGTAIFGSRAAGGAAQ